MIVAHCRAAPHTAPPLIGHSQATYMGLSRTVMMEKMNEAREAGKRGRFLETAEAKAGFGLAMSVSESRVRGTTLQNQM